MDLPICAKKGPYPVEVEKEKSYFWCSCGLSQKQPFCDGSHKGSGMKPLPFIAQETGTVFLCGCKRTKNKPFCDGTHQEI